MTKDPTRIDIRTDPTTLRMEGVTVHKNLRFSVPYISELDDNLWQGGCENGLVLPTFIKHVVSLYPWEKYTIKHNIQSNLAIYMYDAVDQAFDQVDSIARWVNDRRKEGPVLIHCQAGLNRSSLVAARALMLELGTSAHAVIEQIRDKRSTACLCNPSFEEWLKSFD